MSQLTEGSDVTGSSNKNYTLNDLMYRLREWRWPEAFLALLDDVMLITDEDIGRALQDTYGPFKCQISTLEKYAGCIGKTVSKLVFFCRNGEQAQVKKAKRSFPDLQIVSATYDLAGVSIDGGGYFEWQQQTAATDKRDPILIIATPGSDAEYFTETLRRNNICNAREYVNRTVAMLAAGKKDFSLLRFLRAIDQKHGGEQLQLILYTDVLEDLMKYAGLSFERFAWLIEMSRAQVLYFTRRDKSMQSGLLAQLDEELGRSFWASGHLAQPRINDSAPSVDAADAHLNKILRIEVKLEPELGKLTKFKYFTIEETVESPVEVTEAVGNYLGCPVEGDVVWPRYERPYKKRPNLLEFSKEYRQVLINRLGLRLNEHGSYVSDAEFIVKS